MAKELKKGSFIKRVCAYLLDYILIGIVISLIAYPFTDIKKTDELQNEMREMVEKYTNNEISSEEYMIKYNDIYYKLSRTTGVMTFITIIVYILYFVVFQLYNKGQTIGKKVLKIKVISDDGDLSMNQMIFRSFIVNSILLDIIVFGLMIFTPKIVYTSTSSILTIIQYIIIFVSAILATTKEGRTIHDRIAHTRVVVAK